MGRKRILGNITGTILILFVCLLALSSCSIGSGSSGNSDTSQGGNNSGGSDNSQGGSDSNNTGEYAQQVLRLKRTPERSMVKQRVTISADFST